ncbi:organic cation transporter protein-like [Mya arenaria]|uniref:organic cation transporter protein-like n=1 Tax=Mya arenaria TaxID=6604 RepID=UPI0022DF2C2B|nr:organic cation transporter protein-like [Mya arenaria]XP_052795969.1 organic cation transporter protein-like [Mya arenaria]
MEGTSLQELDAVLVALRPWGRFQVFQLFLVFVDLFPAAFAILSAVFTGYIPEFTCLDVENGGNLTVGRKYEVNDDQCSYGVYSVHENLSTLLETKQCTNFSYNYAFTYATEWGLVCGRSNLAALAQSLVIVGQGIGAITTSHLADRVGRKTVHVISHLGILATMGVMAVSSNIYMLLALRLVAGTFQQGMVCTGKILALEIFPRKQRSHIEAITFLAWSFGIMALTLIGWLFQSVDWRYLQLALATCSLYALFQWWMMDESMRWLISNGRIKEAKHILKKAARWNNVDYAKVEAVFDEHVRVKSTMDRPLVLVNGKAKYTRTEKNSADIKGNKTQMKNEKAAATVEKYTVIDILRNPALRANTLILWYSWIVATGTYYGLILVSSHLAGDRFINFFLSGAIEVPSLTLEFYLFNKIGRKRTMILWFAVAAINLVISTVILTVFPGVRAAAIVATGFSLVGKSASTGSLSTVFLYTPEIYPTNYRNSGLGIASSISRIGGLLAPFASNLALIAMWIPGAIFATMCLIVVLLAMRLPESATHELPATIAECETWERHGWLRRDSEDAAA